MLHACGDVSNLKKALADATKFAPRMWRCFSPCLFVSLLEGVCSTHVEMFLSLNQNPLMTMSLLHACGDVSTQGPSCTRTRGFAPRMWRCFFFQIQAWNLARVCSTHVEMFPACRGRDRQGRRLLHACGEFFNNNLP